MAPVSQRSWIQTPYRPECFSGLILTTAQVVFTTARTTFISTSLSAVHIYNFQILIIKKKQSKTKQREKNKKVMLSLSIFHYCSDGVLQDHGINTPLMKSWLFLRASCTFCWVQPKKKLTLVCARYFLLLARSGVCFFSKKKYFVIETDLN